MQSKLISFFLFLIQADVCVAIFKNRQRARYRLVLCCIETYCTALCFALPYPTLPLSKLSCFTLSCLTLPYHTLSDPTQPYPTLPAPSYSTLTPLILSHPLLSPHSFHPLNEQSSVLSMESPMHFPGMEQQPTRLPYEVRHHIHHYFLSL